MWWWVIVQECEKILCIAWWFLPSVKSNDLAIRRSYDIRAVTHDPALSADIVGRHSNDRRRSTMTCRVSQALRRYRNVCIIITFLPWHFIPRVLKLAKATMYVRSGYDRNSDTAKRVGKEQSIKTLNCHWNTFIQERSFPRIGCAKRGSSADFCNAAVSLVWQGTNLPHREKNATCRKRTERSSFSQTRPLRHFLPVAHFATRRMLPVCEQLSHPTWHCVPTAMVPASSHRVVVVSAKTLGLLDGWCFCPVSQAYGKWN